MASAHLGQMLVAARESSDSLRQMNEKKSILLRELTHGVANNFASIAALISLRSTTIKDVEAKAILDEAIEQIRIMGLVHRRLRTRDGDASLGSQVFFRSLCDDLKASIARGRQVAI